MPTLIGKPLRPMPIRPENRKRYPPDWNDISLAIREAAGWRCEECGQPDKRIQPKVLTGDYATYLGGRAMVRKPNTCVLTVAHLDHTPENCERDNLRALCQKCHNRYDAPERAANRKKRLAEEAGQLSMDSILDDAHKQAEDNIPF